MSSPNQAGGVAAYLGAAAVMAAVVATAAGIGVDAIAGKYLPGLPPECPSSTVLAAPLAGLAVSVHNAANVEGLAAATAKALEAKGLKVVSLHNSPAPPDAATGADAVITASSRNLAAAVALQSLLPKSVFMLDEDDPGASLYLTADKPALDGPPDAAAKTLRCSLDE